MRLPNTLFVYDIRKYIFRCTKFMLKVCLFISCRIKPASLKVETDPNRTWAWARNLESHLQNTTTPCPQKNLKVCIMAITTSILLQIQKVSFSIKTLYSWITHYTLVQLTNWLCLFTHLKVDCTVWVTIRQPSLIKIQCPQLFLNLIFLW